jgi:hypothetical protein
MSGANFTAVPGANAIPLLNNPDSLTPEMNLAVYLDHLRRVAPESQEERTSNGI